jgi:hypothetical protein
MELDRAYQRELLQMLANVYPEQLDDRQELMKMSREQRDRYAANMVYLDEHGLVESGLSYGNTTARYPLARITAKGMDFLADDGGLSSILGVVTVKLHEDTLKQLIGQRITESDLPAPEKSKLLEQLKTLPGEAIKHLTLKLVDAGLANWPIAVQAI